MKNLYLDMATKSTYYDYRCLKLMYKKDDGWFTTRKGKEQGGVEKDGFYGQEVLWPEEIANKIKN